MYYQVPQSDFIHTKLSAPLKAEFLRAIRKSEDFATATKFIEAAVTAFTLQSKRGELFAVPLEFVTDKSSDQNQD
ncbi:MAG: hypothetical protein PHQ12_01125 [Chthoniobacteraceae bacterium]|nr:hypothetical protein [Chthoniobacteraceae bacterium]